MENTLGTRKVIVEVDYNELDEFITKYFEAHHNFSGKGKQAFEFVEVQEASNYSSYNFDGINGQLDGWHKRDIEKVIAKGDFSNCNSVYAYLNYLCKQGAIEPADYLVRVSW